MHKVLAAFSHTIVKRWPRPAQAYLNVTYQYSLHNLFIIFGKTNSKQQQQLQQLICRTKVKTLRLIVRLFHVFHYGPLSIDNCWARDLLRAHPPETLSWRSVRRHEPDNVFKTLFINTIGGSRSISRSVSWRQRPVPQPRVPVSGTPCRTGLQRASRVKSLDTVSLSRVGHV